MTDRVPGGSDPHRHAPRRAAVGVLTVSDSRTLDTDRSGGLCATLLEADGHRVRFRDLVRDEPGDVLERLTVWLADPGCDGVIVSGGTGIAPRDRTYEVVAGLLERRLDGFGELFRSLSYAEIGSAAMLSRAVGGISGGRFLFSLPGAPEAVRLAMERLILPELGHLLGLLSPPR